MQDKLKRAITLRNSNQFDEALSVFEELATAFPDNAEVQYHYGWLCDKMGNEAAAVPHYERAIDLGLSGTDLRGALLGLGSTYRTLGRYAQAVTCLRKGAAMFPDAQEFPVFLAMALYNIGQPKEAVALLLKTLVHASSDASIQRFRQAILLYAADLDQVWDQDSGHK